MCARCCITFPPHLRRRIQEANWKALDRLELLAEQDSRQALDHGGRLLVDCKCLRFWNARRPVNRYHWKNCYASRRALYGEVFRDMCAVVSSMVPIDDIIVQPRLYRQPSIEFLPAISLPKTEFVRLELLVEGCKVHMVVNMQTGLFVVSF